LGANSWSGGLAIVGYLGVVDRQPLVVANHDGREEEEEGEEGGREGRRKRRKEETPTFN